MPVLVQPPDGRGAAILRIIDYGGGGDDLGPDSDEDNLVVVEDDKDYEDLTGEVSTLTAAATEKNDPNAKDRERMTEPEEEVEEEDRDDVLPEDQVGRHFLSSAGQKFPSSLEETEQDGQRRRSSNTSRSLLLRPAQSSSLPPFSPSPNGTETVGRPAVDRGNHEYVPCTIVGGNGSGHGRLRTKSAASTDSARCFYVSRDKVAITTTAAATATTRQLLLPRGRRGFIPAILMKRKTVPPKFTFRIIIGSVRAAIRQIQLARYQSERPAERTPVMRQRDRPHHHHRRRRPPTIPNNRPSVIAGNISTVVPPKPRAAPVATTPAVFDGGLRPTMPKRTLHNSLERLRRIELRWAFDNLTRFVPSLVDKERLSKQTILAEAQEFCLYLQVKEAAQCQQRQALFDKRQLLRRRLAELEALPNV